MPIYEYVCKRCDHSLDALQKMSDPPLVDCPACGEPGLKRLLSAPRFRLKGEGWYETDFKKDRQKNLAKADSESAAKETKDEKAPAREEKAPGKDEKAPAREEKSADKPAAREEKSADKPAASDNKAASS